MNRIAHTWSRAQEKMVEMYLSTIVALQFMFVQPATARVSARAKGLSFLEYAILAAAIVGVGVLIARFFGGTLTGLLDKITQDYGSGV